MIITFGVGFFVVFHLAGTQQNESEQNPSVECENGKIPMSLYVLPLNLTLVSVFPYIKNTALRVFATKILKQQCILFWYEKKLYIYIAIGT